MQQQRAQLRYRERSAVPRLKTIFRNAGPHARRTATGTQPMTMKNSMHPYASNVRRRCAPLALALLTALALGGCGGGGSSADSAGSTSPSEDTPSHEIPADSTASNTAVPTPTQPPAPPALSVAATNAFTTGNPTALTGEDAAAMLAKARKIAWDIRRDQTEAVASIYGSETLALNLNHTTNSSSITVNKSTVAAPLILADGGAGMAAIAQIGQGRGLAYGADVLGWMSGTTREQQHYPFFLRAFRWLVTGNGGKALPSTLNFAVAGYSASNVTSYLSRAGSTATVVTCAVADPANTCW